MLKPECLYGDVTFGAEQPFSRETGIDIRAVDAQEGTPVRGATVELWRGVWQPYSPGNDGMQGRPLASGLTGPAGEATITAAFRGVTRGDRYGQSRFVNFNLYTLVVRAEGYVTVQAPLERYTGRVRSDRSSDRVRLDVKLNGPTRSRPT